jgi:hypothetical protein
MMPGLGRLRQEDFKFNANITTKKKKSGEKGREMLASCSFSS